MIANTLRTNLIIQALTFATSIMTARVLGPTGRGELALVLLYPQLVANIALIGMDRAVAVLAGRGELAHPIQTIFKLVLLFAIPTAAVAWITVDWRISDPHLVSLARLYLLYIPAVHCYVLLVAMFNGVGDFRRFNQVRLGFYVVNVAFIAVVWSGAPLGMPVLSAVLLANLASAFGGFFCSIWLLRGFTPNAHVANGARDHRAIWAVVSLAMLYAVPLALAQFNSLAYQIVVDHWMGVKALGVFVVLITYSRLLSPIGSAFGSHVFHLGIRGGQRDIARIFRLSLIIYLCGIAPLWLGAAIAIPFVFGREFVVDTSVVGVLLASTLFSMLADSLAEYLNGQRRVRADIVGRLLYITTLALIAYALIPSLGLLGIALAMAAGDLVRCAWLVRQVAAAANSQAVRFIWIRSADVTELLRESHRLLGKVFAR